MTNDLSKITSVDIEPAENGWVITLWGTINDETGPKQFIYHSMDLVIDKLKSIDCWGDNFDAREV